MGASIEANPSSAKVGKSRTANPPGPPESVEQSVVILEPMKEGVIALGDLWDCRGNKCTGSLFDKSLTSEYMQADVISTLSYFMTRSKRASDISNLLKVSAALKCEMAMGKLDIKIEGSGSYEKTENSKFNEESISVYYETTTYRVRVLPSVVTDGKVSETVKKNIMDGKELLKKL